MGDVVTATVAMWSQMTATSHRANHTERPIVRHSYTNQARKS